MEYILTLMYCDLLLFLYIEAGVCTFRYATYFIFLSSLDGKLSLNYFTSGQILLLGAGKAVTLGKIWALNKMSNPVKT